MNRLLAFLICCSLLLVPAVAQAGTTGKIAGTVKDRASGQPLPGAVVTVEGTKLGAVADATGRYFIINIPPGTYRVNASMVGYGRLSQTGVRVYIDQTRPLDFQLGEEMIQAGEMVVTAERPKVELDLTASKESMSRDEIARSWGTTVEEVISDIPASNINGGIRGSFGNDYSYNLDGIDLRDPGSNTNFSSVNLTTIQEVEVLTGGWNAEFGQANGSIINIVTRRAQDRVRGIVSYKVRPSGKYHWGRDFYGAEDFMRTTMTTPEFWDPTKTWKSQWMTTGLAGYDGGIEPFKSMTPQQRADWWKAFVNDKTQFPQIDYADRAQWEQEITLYGPLVTDLSFLLSGRYQEGVGVYPSAYKFNPDYTLQGTLDWSVAEATRLSLTGMFNRFLSSGAPRTNYQSSETNPSDIAVQQLPYIRDPYTDYKYWQYGTRGGSDQFTIRPPEEAQLLSMQAKLTHVFDASTFLEAALQHSAMKYRLDYRDIARSANFPSFGLPISPLPDSASGLPGYGLIPTGFVFAPRWGYPGDVWRSWTDTRSWGVKADLTSQVHPSHLVKAGLVFSYQEFDKVSKEGGLTGSSSFAQVNDLIKIVDRPYEGGVYLQDKIEVGGMVVNAGLRFDFFNANKNVSADIYDPLMIGRDTHGGDSTTIGIAYYRPDQSGPGYSKTKTRVAFSPRIGISHPITETTVLHFMYGVFHQRPSWNKILANPVVWTALPYFNPATLDPEFNLPESTRVTYRYFGQKVGNPALTWEKMIQYEIGFEQNILNKLSVDVTMYYKDASDLTSLGIDQGPASTQIQESGGNVDIRLYGDPVAADTRIPGQTIGNFTTTVNGAWADVRGIEVKLKSRFQWINFDFAYTLSYLSTGTYHLNKKFKTFYDENGNPYQRGTDTYSGASNTDNGGVGLDDASWNPHNSAILKLSFLSAPDFGPAIGEFYIFGDWAVTTSTRWAAGQQYTYYPTDFVGVQVPNNKTWESRWNTNLNISRMFRVFGDMRLNLYAQVTNLFDDQHLRLFSGQDLRDYEEQGILPVQSTTREPLEWSWYSNLPRQIVLGTSVEF